MWGMETLKKLKQKAGSRETEPSAGAAPAQGAASSTAPDARDVYKRQPPWSSRACAQSPTSSTSFK